MVAPENVFAHWLMKAHDRIDSMHDTCLESHETSSTADVTNECYQMVDSIHEAGMQF